MAASGRFRFKSERHCRCRGWADRPPIPQDRGPFGPGTACETEKTLSEAEADKTGPERRAA
ncbi:hypothetical protein Slala04_37170 [Streptomyces lavendulae subsp. lavendulae]|nr:hypothetical protein Slala04_37170 [Streptomyces lavendulae subsp. lavendulae]